MYKMIGPALVKQDTLEAQSNVNKRLEFIGGAFLRRHKLRCLNLFHVSSFQNND